MSTRIKAIVLGLLSLVVLTVGGYQAFKWGVMRVFVDHDEILIVTSRFGDTLPPDRRTVRPDEGLRGVQEEVLGPGRYFFDPIRFEVEIAKQTVVSAGDPGKWDWDEMGNIKDRSTVPQVGLVTSLEGKTAENADEVVGEGFKGIQRRVLTPGTYKINPVRFKVDMVPAVVVPPGSVGVVTRLVDGPVAAIDAQPLSAGPDGAVAVGAFQRGILQDVLQPGIYYLNPRLVKVTVVPVGYDAITTEGDAVGSQVNRATQRAIEFLTMDGYSVEADFTVVWGRTPADAPDLVRNIGNIDRVSQVVIEPAMKAAAQNEGAKFTARELIQGQTRSAFQDALSNSLERQVTNRNIQILLALVRNITIKDPAGRDETEGLLRTIQRANIEVERELTTQQKTLTAAKRAEYEQALKQVDVARETVASETQVRVANLQADARKSAAQIGAQTEVEVARIRAEVAQLEAQRTQILGRATSEVTRLRNDAEAQGDRLLIEALGSPSAYNQYIFAKNFSPRELRLIFAGQGTFWTDLRTFQEVGATQAIQNATTRPAR